MHLPNFSKAFRSFYWLQVDEEELDAALTELVNQLSKTSETLLISERSLLGFEPVPSREAIRWLGRDTQRIIVNAFSGFNPNAFAQVCGTLKGGGELILVTPKADVWISYEDPEYCAMRGSRYGDYVFPGFFIRHLVRQLTADKVSQVIPPQPHHERSFDFPYLSAEQSTLVQQLVKEFELSRYQPFDLTQVITADRGRGKTSALGLALAQLVRLAESRNVKNTSSTLHVVVTAPSREALDSLFTVLKRQLPEGECSGSGFQHEQLSLRFYPPSVLLQKSLSADLIIIDEAAAIPVSILQKIQQLGVRHWYASTLHGYEGNGRGFELRFLAWLKHHNIAFQCTHLTEPVRWASDDPLEALSYRLLLLDAEPGSLDPSTISRHDLRYVAVSQAALVENASLLKQIFGLLIAAHYRTTPNDLRQLLDSPDLLIRVLMHQQTPVAVAVLVEEGPLADELIDAIWSGYRRPSGDLIPQTLLSREGITEAGSLRGWRVMRIAVHPGLQRLGMGSMLLENIHTEASGLGLDFCGASFAADVSLFSFWQANHYLPLRLGERSDRVTAGWPLLVLNSLTKAAQVICEEVWQTFSERLVLKLTITRLRSEEVMLMHCLASLPDCVTLTRRESEIIRGFALHQRSLEDSLLCLRKWLAIPENMKQILSWPETEQSLVVGRIFQLKTADLLESHTSVSGKRAQLQKLRCLCRQLISNLNK